MGGRPSKPVDLIVLEKKSHRTKAELEQRKEAERSLYTGEAFQESPEVKADPSAHKEFMRLKRLYKKIAYVDALDQPIINRYCMELANLARLQVLARKMEEKIDECENLETKDIIQLYKCINGVLGKMNTSKELLLKYEDRLFLNPAGRMRSIPKQPEKKEEASGLSAFLAKREVK